MPHRAVATAKVDCVVMSDDGTANNTPAVHFPYLSSCASEQRVGVSKRRRAMKSACTDISASLSPATHAPELLSR